MHQTTARREKRAPGQYAERFSENDIDFAVLSDLTDQALEEVGVTSLGHRRKLLRAIADLTGVEKITRAVASGAVGHTRRTSPGAGMSRAMQIHFHGLSGWQQLV
jgi:hypothetical protein